MTSPSEPELKHGVCADTVAIWVCVNPSGETLTVTYLDWPDDPKKALVRCYIVSGDGSNRVLHTDMFQPTKELLAKTASQCCANLGSAVMDEAASRHLRAWEVIRGQRTLDEFAAEIAAMPMVTVMQRAKEPSC